jgi:hypothetical protein
MLSDAILLARISMIVKMMAKQIAASMIPNLGDRAINLKTFKL